MMMFGSYEPIEADVDDERVEHALAQIKRNARNRRIAMVAPVALAAAMFSAFVAAPQEHGGLSLVPEAEASNQDLLPRVFGANGVWRFAEPITDARTDETRPPSMIAVDADPSSPDFVLQAPGDNSQVDAVPTSTRPTSTIAGSVVYGAAPSSLPVSVSSPPTPTLGQSDVQADLRVETPPVVAPPSAPDVSAPVETTTTPDNSSSDEDVTESPLDGSLSDSIDGQLPETSGQISLQANVLSDEAESGPEVNPSTPQAGSTDQGTQLSSAVATIVPGLVLVQRAHVSVTVQVVDDDSSVIDWCNTRVDWGDGSITGMTSPDGNASCAASCELDAIPTAAGAIDATIDQEITFTHDYAVVIDAAPRVFVATGDGCSYTLAEYQLNPFTVVPY